MNPLLATGLSLCSVMLIAAIPLIYQSRVLELEESWRKKMLAKNIRKTAKLMIIGAAILIIVILAIQILIILNEHTPKG